jgi:hypothetical protein
MLAMRDMLRVQFNRDDWLFSERIPGLGIIPAEVSVSLTATTTIRIARGASG